MSVTTKLSPNSKKPAWTKAELQRFFKTARRVLQSSEFDIRIAPKMRELGRLLIVTSRKTGKAHQRNRFRRRVKAAAHSLQLSQQAYDWGIFAKTSIDTLTFAEITARFLQVLEQYSQKQCV